ncbi:hypothetical protein OFO99_32220, partial [Escherichia coli]|nr:hypothetical protein [Escherichia coli]
EGVEKEQAFDTEGKPVLDVHGNPVFNHLYAGDLLENRDHIDTDMFYGFDFDSTMLRVAASDARRETARHSLPRYIKPKLY